MSTAYTTLDQVYAKLPKQFVDQALDDDNDGVADDEVWEAVSTGAAREVDGLLAMRYTVPFSDPLPAVVVNASLQFVMEALYDRRGYIGEKNPFIGRANAERKKLQAIGSGDLPLTPERVKATPSVSTVTEPARTSSAFGNLST